MTKPIGTAGMINNQVWNNINTQGAKEEPQWEEPDVTGPIRGATSDPNPGLQTRSPGLDFLNKETPPIIPAEVNDPAGTIPDDWTSGQGGFNPNDLFTNQFPNAQASMEITGETINPQVQTSSSYIAPVQTDAQGNTPEQIAEIQRQLGLAAGAQQGGQAYQDAMAARDANASQVGDAMAEAEPKPSSDIFGDSTVADDTPSMDLEEQGYMTEGGPLVEDFWLDQFQSGEFSDVENTRKNLDRESDQFEYKVMKQARDAAAQAGMPPGSAGYNELMQNAMSQANQKRIESERGINQMQRDYRDTATEKLQGIEDTAWAKSVGERTFDFQRDDVEYIRDEQSAQGFLDNIKDQKTRQHLEQAYLEGGIDGLKSAAGNVLDEFGTINEPFRSQTPTQNEIEALDADIAASTTSPDGDPWKDGEKATYGAQLRDSYLRDKYGMNSKEIKEFNLNNDTTSIVADVLAGDANISDITAEQWGAMSTDDLESISEPFNDGMTFLRTGDFNKSGLMADNLEESTDDGAMKSNGGAGEGNGSIVSIGGKPYRITRYWTKKDTTNINERNGRVYAVPLSGPNAGKEEPISETGWKKI